MRSRLWWKQTKYSKLLACSKLLSLHRLLSNHSPACARRAPHVSSPFPFLPTFSIRCREKGASFVSSITPLYSRDQDPKAPLPPPPPPPSPRPQPPPPPPQGTCFFFPFFNILYQQFGIKGSHPISTTISITSVVRTGMSKLNHQMHNSGVIEPNMRCILQASQRQNR